ncbi:MAG: fluoride efflux transporter CrcB [Acidimicrobiales bacterium]|nr:MAG: fluoride efflux transporter CrcB [Acidimicrobiales bacterium]
MGLALAVGVAGALGAVTRYLVDSAITDRHAGSFPWGTLTVNVAGSFILGLVAGLVLHHAISPSVQVVVGVGFCGALTTWSTATWESVRLVQEGVLATALVFTVANLVVSLLVAGLGLAVSAL